MIHTVQTRLRLSQEESDTLSELLATLGHARRCAAKKLWVEDFPVSKISTWMSQTHGIHVRHADGIRIGLTQMEKAWRERHAQRMEAAGRSAAYFERLAHENSIALDEARQDYADNPLNRGVTRRRIAKLKKALFETRSSRDHWTSVFNRLKEELKIGKPKVCFGGVELERERHFVGTTKGLISTHQEWLEHWRAARNGYAWIVGSKAEPYGNLSCQLDPVNKTLLVSLSEVQIQRNLEKLVATFKKVPSRIPGKLATMRMVIQDVKLPEQGALLYQRALAEQKPITMRIVKSLKRDGVQAFHLHVSFDVEQPPVSSKSNSGALGVHIDGRHCSWVAVDRFGNPRRASLSIPKKSGETAGSEGGLSPALLKLGVKAQIQVIHGSRDWKLSSSSHSQQLDAIGNAVADLIACAQHLQCPIVISQENYQKRKRELNGRGDARQVDSFADANFNALLYRSALRNGVEVIQVDSEHAAVAGMAKFGVMNGFNAMQATAMALARKGVLGKTRQPVKAKSKLQAPLKGGVSQTLAQPAITKPKKMKRNQAKREFIERVSFSRSMPVIKQSISGGPRDSVWRRLADVLGSDDRSWGSSLFPAGTRAARRLLRRNRKIPPSSGNSDVAVPGAREGH